MASRTIVDSVARVEGPPANLQVLEAELAALRRRFPGVIFDRYLGKVPSVGARVHIAPGAVIVGDVVLHEDSSVWYGCVLRGDVNQITLGPRSNIQDGSVVHLGDEDPTVIEEDVVIGHRAVVHGCRIGAGTLVGIQSTVLDGADIGHGSIVGAGALVTAGTVVAPHSLMLGTPAKCVKTLDPDAEAFHRKLAGKYTRLSHNYRIG